MRNLMFFLFYLPNDILCDLRPCFNSEMVEQSRVKNFKWCSFIFLFPPLGVSASTYCCDSKRTRTFPYYLTIGAKFNHQQNCRAHEHISSNKCAFLKLFILVNSSISEGELVHIFVTARDDKNESMSSGGDFWLAVMSAHDNRASTAGRVVDYTNGTYSIYFYAAWSGRANISIVLYHPSKAVQYIRDKFWKVESKMFWNAQFNVKSKKNSTTLCCLVSPNSSMEYSCLYPALDALGNYTLGCKPYRRPSLHTCPSLTTMWIASKETVQKNKQIVGKDIALFQK